MVKFAGRLCISVEIPMSCRIKSEYLEVVLYSCCVCVFVALDKNSTDYKVLLLTVYCEAGVEGERGQVAVAWVIKNRLDARNHERLWGEGTIAAVCKKFTEKRKKK